MIIAIGTKNPTKVNAVKAAFSPVLDGEFVSVNVASGVSAQPLSDDETITGAINRAKNAYLMEDAQLGVGLEGGIVKTEYGYFLCNWGAVVNSSMKPIIAGGSRIILPKEVGEEVFKGTELGDVMDQYAQKSNVRQNEGAIGIFTAGFVNRTEMFTHLSKLLVGQYLYKHVSEK